MAAQLTRAAGAGKHRVPSESSPSRPRSTATAWSGMSYEDAAPGWCCWGAAALPGCSIPARQRLGMRPGPAARARCTRGPAGCSPPGASPGRSQEAVSPSAPPPAPRGACRVGSAAGTRGAALPAALPRGPLAACDTRGGRGGSAGGEPGRRPPPPAAKRRTAKPGKAARGEKQRPRSRRSAEGEPGRAPAAPLAPPRRGAPPPPPPASPAAAGTPPPAPATRPGTAPAAPSWRGVRARGGLRGAARNRRRREPAAGPAGHVRP